MDLVTFASERWRDLFGINYKVLLYDLTNTYFESDPPFRPTTSAVTDIYSAAERSPVLKY
jgi:hypothetical protein